MDLNASTHNLAYHSSSCPASVSVSGATMSFSNRPGKIRQRSLEYLQSTTTAQPQASSASTLISCSVVILAPAIAAIVIAAQYDASSSECDNEQFIIDLPTFLYVAAGMMIADIVLFRCGGYCCGILSVTHNCAALFMWYSLTQTCCFAVAHLIYAGIGIYLYNNEMSAACQEEPIGKMVLAWDIFIYVVFGSSLCCLCFSGATLLKTMSYLKTQTQQANDEANTAGDANDVEETDPLL